MDGHLHLVTFGCYVAYHTGPVKPAIVPRDTGDVPGYRFIFRVDVKDALLIAVRVLCNLLVLCYFLMNYNMTVILYLGMRGKVEVQDDAVAEDPSDFRLTLDCMETKEEV